MEIKKIACAAWILICANLATAQYKPLDEGSSVTFKVRNFGFSSGGFFKGLNGTITFDPSNLPASRFDVTIDATSVNTDNDLRDEHLREETYFDVRNYPKIHFLSSRITGSSKAGNYQVVGALTIKKTTREISFPFEASKTADGFLFSGEFRINRKDFGIGGSSTISDNVTVFLAVRAIKQ